MGTNYDVKTWFYPEGWHLGKQSAGWPFIFHADEEWSSGETLGCWLARAASGPIVDEYGREIGFAALMRMIFDSYDNSQRKHPDAFEESGYQFLHGEFS